MLPPHLDLTDRLVSFFELANTIPELKRRLFIALLVMGILALVLDATLRRALGSDWVNLSAVIVLILFFTAMLWLLWRRRERQELILLGIFLGSALFLLTIMFFNLVYLQVPSPAETFLGAVSPWFIWFILLDMASFLTFRASTALRLSLLVSGLLILTLLGYIWRVGPFHLMVVRDFMVLSLANVIVLLMAYPLAQAQEQNSESDFLTGLANRTRAYNLLASELERAQRYGTHFAVILFDIDYFKKINDTYGHPTGDAVLRQVASFIGQQVRRTDTLARWGGEEFLLLMPHTDLASAKLKAEYIRQKIKNHGFSKVVGLTASFGVTSFQPSDSTNTLLERADHALYTAKRNGRNCVEVA